MMPHLPDMPHLPEAPAPPDLSSLGGAADTARHAADAMGVALPPQVNALLGAVPGGAPGGAPSGAAPGGAAPNVDELYEGIIERLRRDLIVERERMGDLLGSLGH